MEDLWQHIPTEFGWRDYVDIGVLTLVAFRVYLWLRGTVGFHLVLVLLLIVAGAVAANRAGLLLTTYVLQGLGALAALIFAIVFQQEIRTAIRQASPLRWVQARLLRRQVKANASRLAPLAQGLVRLAEKRLGALVVLRRLDPVEDHLTGGTPVAAEASPEILEAIFHTRSPIHDGALLVDYDQIQRAGAVLPLAEGPDSETAGGTRHRAALGLTQACDAVVLVVSEERGEISIAQRGELNVAPADAPALQQAIGETLEGVTPPSEVLRRARRGWVRRYVGGAAAFAVILTAVTATWLVLLGDRSTVVTREILLELRGLNDTHEVTVVRPKGSKVQVRVQGPRELLESSRGQEVSAWINLEKAKPRGFTWLKIHVRTPTGITLVDVNPKKALVKIKRKKGVK